MSQPTVGDVAYDDQEFIDAVRNNEPATTKEVADDVGLSRQGADYRLRQLEDRGKVASKKAGHDLIWMLADDE
jgi:predicted transcriptional regulator